MHAAISQLIPVGKQTCPRTDRYLLRRGQRAAFLLELRGKVCQNRAGATIEYRSCTICHQAVTEASWACVTLQKPQNKESSEQLTIFGPQDEIIGRVKMRRLKWLASQELRRIRYQNGTSTDPVSFTLEIRTYLITKCSQ